ncbi:MAG: hypothetical protein Q8P34_15805 [Bacteroidota bacterium]|nr:hypothetical protein [Bacteroidota bacterium]
MDYLVKYFSELYCLVGEMAPWLLPGLVFAGLLKVYFPQKHIAKQSLGINIKKVYNELD